MELTIETPSICIPRVLPGINPNDVKKVFEKILECKCVERVDLVKAQNKYQRAFIHFNYYPSNEIGEYIKERILTGKTLNIVYEAPWFWKCSISKVPKPAW